VGGQKFGTRVEKDKAKLHTLGVFVICHYFLEKWKKQALTEQGNEIQDKGKLRYFYSIRKAMRIA